MTAVCKTDLGGRTARASSHRATATAYAASVTATLAIFALLAWCNRPMETPAVTVYEDTQAVTLPETPPPPAPTEVVEQPTAAINQLLMLAQERSDSDVKLPAAIIVPDYVPESGGRPQFEVSLQAAKPSVEPPATEVRHVFERSEVDEQPRPILKKGPNLSGSQVKSLKVPRVRFIFVVNTDGTVDQPRLFASTGEAAVDQACLEALQVWKFTPAIRKGRPVRCWAEQGFTIRMPAAKNPFES